MRIADYAHDSLVDGPGLRFTLFAQGCPHACEGCHNPHTLDPQGGREEPVEDIIRAMLENPLTDGLTLSGGEPFIQPEACVAVARAARARGLNVWIYSGFTFETLLAQKNPAVRELLELSDVLVDGPFRLSARSLLLRWRGSHNQRVLDVPQSLANGRAVLWEEG